MDLGRWWVHVMLTQCHRHTSWTLTGISDTTFGHPAGTIKQGEGIADLKAPRAPRMVCLANRQRYPHPGTG
jgi:hypothetical protein